MSNRIASKSRATRHVASSAVATVLATAFAMSLAQPAQAESATPPAVPASIEVPEGHVPYLVGHAVGTQNYACLPEGNGVVWKLYTPQATLFSDTGRQLITHFFSPNPLAPAEFLPTWQHSRDTSAVWVKADAAPYTDPDFVEPGAVAWLRLRVVAAEGGSFGGNALTATTFIHRVNTSGGVAPSTGCTGLGDVGKKAFVPYTADYFFYMEEA